MEYLTLTRDDPDFNNYLLGTFSSDHRALPVETYHASTARERVTFRVVPLEKLSVPRWWRIYFWSCRPELLGLTLAPSIVAWLAHADLLNEWTRWPSWFALAGIFFLHTAVFLMNDVQDHMRGFDRSNRRRGSQVIQKGWVRAADMKRWAVVNFTLAVLFGVPAFFNAPLGLLLVCALAGLSLLVILRGWGTRWGLSDLSLLLLFGPLLTSGIALASFGISDWTDMVLGLSMGALTLWVFQVRQFEDLFRSKPESSHTMLGSMTFDRVKIVCVVEGVLLLLLQPLAAMALELPLVMLALAPLVSIPLVLTCQRFMRAASPLSSSLVGSSHWALGSHLAWTLWWIVALGVMWL